MHSMMTDDIITGKASIKGREDVENVVCSLNRIKAIRGKYSAEELSGEPPQAMITCYDENVVLSQYSGHRKCDFYAAPSA